MRCVLILRIGIVGEDLGGGVRKRVVCLDTFGIPVFDQEGMGINLHKIIFVFVEQGAQVSGIAWTFCVLVGDHDPTNLLVPLNQERIIPRNTLFVIDVLKVVLFTGSNKNTVWEFGILQKGLNGFITCLVSIRSDGYKNSSFSI